IVKGNPFLAKYSVDPKRYSFDLQIFFLNHWFSAVMAAMIHPYSVLDRALYADAIIFASVHYENGSIDEAEYSTYCALHENMMQELADLYKQQILFKESPDLMVMVHGSFEEIMRRIIKRGRPYEQIDGNPELSKYYRDLYEMYDNNFMKD